MTALHKLIAELGENVVITGSIPTATGPQTTSGKSSAPIWSLIQVWLNSLPQPLTWHAPSKPS
jgi:hypothetical protein